MKRALVFGSQIEGLSGVENDTAAVAAMLEARNFEVDLRTGAAASRAGILAGYRALIEAVRVDRGAGDPAQGDAAVVYYSGHGFYGTLPGNDGTWQAIAPTDLNQGSDTDFRGITAWELSILQARLTEQTHNVTVILDCCHSSQMSKDAAARNAVSRGLAHPVRIGLAAHIEALHEEYGVMPTLDPLGNPHAVRLVAAAQHESAFEYRTDSGVQHGVFTESLLDVLREVGTSEISWAAIGDAVRARVLRSFVTQRPDVEGPRDRMVFSLHQVNANGIVGIRAVGNQLELAAGGLTGVTQSDVYGVMPVGSLRYDPARAIAEVAVSAVHPLTAQLEVRTWLNGHTTMPVDAVAVPRVRNAIRRPIALAGAGPQRDALQQTIDTHAVLRVANSGEQALGTLALDGDQLTLSDELGPLYAPVKLTGAAELDRMVHNAANLGFAQAVRALAGEHGVYAAELAIELGAVENGEPRPLHDRPALGLGDRFYIKVTNRGQRQLYVHVLDIGLQSSVSVLTGNVAPAGFLIQAGTSYVLGKHPNGKLTGVGIGWPDTLPREGFPRLDEYMVVVTSSPVNLSALEAQARGGRKARGGKLVDLLSQLQDGAPKDARLDEPMEGYFARSLSYLLYPRDARIGGIAFEIDENPSGQAALRDSAAWTPAGAKGGPGAAFEPAAPEQIAIRLGDLVVERNRALWSADVRVDALICTRVEHGRDGHATWTQKFSGINDGERVPLDNALLYCGPVRDFVDITLFVSRDTRGALDLAGLFASRATSSEFREAAGALLVAAGAAASPWAAAVGASAVLTRMAYELVLAVAGKSIGLYRTSFLRRERYGIGRLPAEGLHRAQDFSFSLLIEPQAPDNP